MAPRDLERPPSRSIRAIPISAPHRSRRLRAQLPRVAGRIAETRRASKRRLLRRWRDPDLIKRATEITNGSTSEKLLSLLTKSHADRSADDEKFISSQAEKLGVDLEPSRPGIPNFPTPSLLLKRVLEQIKSGWQKAAVADLGNLRRLPLIRRRPPSPPRGI